MKYLQVTLSHHGTTDKKHPVIFIRQHVAAQILATLSDVADSVCNASPFLTDLHGELRVEVGPADGYTFGGLLAPQSDERFWQDVRVVAEAELRAPFVVHTSIILYGHGYRLPLERAIARLNTVVGSGQENNAFLYLRSLKEMVGKLDDPFTPE